MSYLTVAIVLVCLMELEAVQQPQFAKEREAFFNRTSYIRLSTPLNLLNTQIGFNFRSCSGGQLFVQSSSLYKNKISLNVTSESLTLSIIYSGRAYESKIYGKFLDNKWHPVNIAIRPAEMIMSTEEDQQVGMRRARMWSEIFFQFHAFTSDSIIIFTRIIDEMLRCFLVCNVYVGSFTSKRVFFFSTIHLING